MKAPQLKINQDKSLEIINNFEFELSDKLEIDSDNFIPRKRISFFWNPELEQDYIAFLNEDEAYEIIGEKLKNDFINFLKTKNKK